MDSIALKAMVKELAPVIREYAEAAQAPLIERLAALESQNGDLAARCQAFAEAAAKEPEIDLAQVEKLIEAEIAKLPPPPKEIDREELAEMVSEAVAAIPPPQDGKSVTVEDVAPLIAAEVEKATDPRDINLMVAAEVAKVISTLPKPKDGEPGKSAAGIVEALKDSGELVLTLEDGRLIRTGIRDGERGKDGFGFEDMDACVLNDDRTIELSFRRGEEEKAFTFKWPTMIYRNVFKEGTEYQQGDVVTWAGSLWHCDKATSAKPGTDDWTLAAKKGRDGKDAKVG